jgi:hypothetical protein
MYSGRIVIETQETLFADSRQCGAGAGQAVSVKWRSAACRRPSVASRFASSPRNKTGAVRMDALSRYPDDPNLRNKPIGQWDGRHGNETSGRTISRTHVVRGVFNDLQGR